MKKELKIFPFAGAGLSGVLLFLCFPPFEFDFLAWVALVPLIFVCSKTPRPRAAFYGWLSGAVFFIGSLYWLRNVTWAGYLALAFYSALYFIPFAVLIASRADGWGGLQRMKNLGWMFMAAAVWAASEYMRGFLLTGFPWNFFGVSQYAQISLIQIAEWGGVFILSALLVIMNTAVASTLLQYVSGVRSFAYKMHIEIMVAVFLLAAASSFGLHVLFSTPVECEPVRVALIQPNIPEVGNWELADPELIYKRLTDLTELASQTPDLDLIVWPETALPDFVRYSSRSYHLITRFCTQVPLLVGSMDARPADGGGQEIYNSSLLFDTEGNVSNWYNKQHLVLFGEYIPFDGQIEWIDALTPIQSSFTAGKKQTQFYLPNDARPFSVLICFEDTLPYLARRAVKKGASWLMNQTNDSWFDPDCGSIQHLAHAVFRTVENRRPLVRCTNTGISCFIDAEGRIRQTLDPRTQGYDVVEVIPADPKEPLTFYTRYGDLFARTCLLASVVLFIFIPLKSRKKKNA